VADAARSAGTTEPHLPRRSSLASRYSLWGQTDLRARHSSLNWPNPPISHNHPTTPRRGNYASAQGKAKGPAGPAATPWVTGAVTIGGRGENVATHRPLAEAALIRPMNLSDSFRPFRARNYWALPTDTLLPLRGVSQCRTHVMTPNTPASFLAARHSPLATHSRDRLTYGSTLPFSHRGLGLAT
jgi:hypothetical protein